ncbi:MAG: efflux RND transporter periplasmic adaptor subunit [Desulfomonilaceae bacterium]|nr:efflux RND transporter periplasmic adaptor subunit [Desulfomonilaceae bacterium]
MKTSLKILILAILVGAFAAGTFASRIAPPQPNPKFHGRMRIVKAAEVQPANHVRQIRFPGVARAVRRAKLSFTLGERLISRPVDVGDHVEEGRIIAVLDDRRIANSVEEVEAALRELDARIDQILTDHTRFESLVETDAVSGVELERIVEKKRVLVASREAAEARLREAKRMLKESILKAPFSATVTEVLIQPGEFATPGAPVVVLSGDGDVEIEVEVPESSILKLSVGNPVTVDLPLAGKTGLKGKIEYLGKTALGPGRLFPVLVKLDNVSDAAPGMTAEVVFQTEEISALSVPLSAVIDPGGQSPALFTVREGKVRKVPVEVGEVVGERVTVKGDLEPNQLVVSGGHLSLLDGDSVEVREDERL